MKLTNEQFQKITNTNLTEGYWKLELGVGYVYYNEPDNIKFSKPYPEIGESFWYKIESSIRGIICKDGKPKSQIEEVINGDIRSLAEAILSIVVATYEVTLAIAIPITALVLKKGILNFCSEPKSEELNPEIVKGILETKSLESEEKKKR